ncbi:MAG: hypothetical protein F6K48_03230 [Okeania sp. SIO3H1]|nr:hypothetical protein [Okeania sp. SIO3H1]
MPVFRTVTDAQQGEIKLEAIHQPLYDQATINGAATYSYFQNPAGRGRFATNLTTAGQLSWPKRFSIRALRQVPAFTALASELQTLFSNTVLRVTVGEKDYLILPAFLITAGVGLEVQFVTGAAAPAAPATGENYVTNGRPNQQNIYSLIHSIYLPPVQNFNVQLEVGTAVGSDVPVHLFLEGEYLREIQ